MHSCIWVKYISMDPRQLNDQCQLTDDKIDIYVCILTFTKLMGIRFLTHKLPGIQTGKTGDNWPKDEETRLHIKDRYFSKNGWHFGSTFIP